MPSQATEGVERPIPRPAGTRAAWSAAGRRMGPHAPDLLLALYWLLFLPTCLTLPWGSDLGLHLATVGRLEHHLLAPGNPVLRLDTTSPYYSPYTVTIALLGRLTGIGPIGMMKAAALFDVALVLTGVRAFTRRLTPARWAPPLVFLLMMLLWGTRYIAWSGFFSAASLAVSISYPSTFALGVLLHVWSLVARATGRGPALGWAGHAGAGVLMAVLALSHQFTAVGATLGVVCLLVSRGRTLSRNEVPRLALAVITALVVLLAWPYYHFWQLGSQMRELDPLHHAVYHVAYYWLAVVALPALVARWRRDHLDPLVTLAVLAGLVVGYGALSGHYSLGRTFPEVMLPLQTALGVELADGFGSRLRVPLVGLTAAALVLGAVGQSAVVTLHTARALEPRTRHVLGVPLRGMTTLGRYGWITAHVRRGDVVLTDDYLATEMSAAYGAYVVAPPWYDPELPEDYQLRRIHDVHAFFAPGEPGRIARRTLRAYHVGWIIVPGYGGLPAGVPDTLVATGPRGARLYRVGRAPR